MPRVWVKVPKITKFCACGCGVLITGTKRKMYAKPYCKLRMHLLRTGKMNNSRDRRFPNPLTAVIPFTLGEEVEQDLSSSI